jgi:tRNA(Met) C34 N-acetyltransferase TmcA
VKHAAAVQDFEALTPNLLARTIETVEGGGLVILLLSNLSSLTQLYTLTMDVHSRLRTDAHQTVTGAGSIPSMYKQVFLVLQAVPLWGFTFTVRCRDSAVRRARDRCATHRV